MWGWGVWELFTSTNIAHEGSLKYEIIFGLFNVSPLFRDPKQSASFENHLPARLLRRTQTGMCVRIKTYTYTHKCINTPDMLGHPSPASKPSDSRAASRHDLAGIRGGIDGPS